MPDMKERPGRSRRRATRTAKAGTTKDNLMPRIARSIFHRTVKASATKAGLPGVVAGAAFNMLLRRSPAGAAALGVAILAHRAYRVSKKFRSKKAAKAEVTDGGEKTTPAKAPKPKPVPKA